MNKPDSDNYLVVLENGQMYLFWADDVEHAIEQAKDAEPNQIVQSVYKLELIWDANYE